ncbi:hypothetical protein KBX71_07680 [Micromonospora sp. D93]|uniref:hypothetical protein n=1 Tax=Micromonospora sp. D93 TaxID=2824886 RepID=UPI001B35A891|nr:hypothetical protein [Micromonospora sp. D93]MBQ1017749.1 hypothetical protein [Micromonospora sp. D93]
MARTKAGKLGPCQCSRFEVGTTTDGPDGIEPDITIETTGCDRETPRLFAQGHDAKLVGFLVRAELEGKEVRYGRAEGVVISSDAVSALGTISDALAAKGAAMLASRRAKAATKKTKKVEPQPRTAVIKVGRHIMAGASIAPDGTASYTTKAGEAKTAPAGKFTEIEEDAK